MNTNQLDSFQLAFNRQAPGQGVTCVVSVKAAPQVQTQELFAFWQERRHEILVAPEVVGLSVDPNGEDISIAVNKRTITGTIKFLDPPLAKKA